MRTLYYLSGTDPDDAGDDYTLFAVADSPEQAHAIWKQHWWEGDGAPFYNGAIVPGMRQGREEVLLIYALEYDPDVIGALKWHELDVVGHVRA